MIFIMMNLSNSHGACLRNGEKATTTPSSQIVLSAASRAFSIFLQ